MSTILLTLHDVEPAVRLNARLEGDGHTTALVSPLDDIRAEIRRAKPNLIVISGELHDAANVGNKDGSPGVLSESAAWVMSTCVKRRSPSVTCVWLGGPLHVAQAPEDCCASDRTPLGGRRAMASRPGRHSAARKLSPAPGRPSCAAEIAPPAVTHV